MLHHFIPEWKRYYCSNFKISPGNGNFNRTFKPYYIIRMQNLDN